jgi:hypothetical protein
MPMRAASNHLTDACLGLKPDRLAQLDGQGVQIGGYRASKTIMLHR